MGRPRLLFFFVLFCFFCEVCGKGVGKGDLDATGYVHKQLPQKDVQDLKKQESFQVASIVTRSKLRSVQIYEFGSRYMQQTRS